VQERIFRQEPESLALALVHVHAEQEAESLALALALALALVHAELKAAQELGAKSPRCYDRKTNLIKN
jgi:hypothetical protein